MTRTPKDASIELEAMISSSQGVLQAEGQATEPSLKFKSIFKFQRTQQSGKCPVVPKRGCVCVGGGGQEGGRV